MEKDIKRLHQKIHEGKCCTQVMVSMGLELKQESNPQLEQVAAALCQGIRSGLTCGVLTGAAMMLYLFDPEKAVSRMIPELSQWFQEVYGEAYGGIDCDTMIEKNPLNKPERCPAIMESTYRKAMELLEDEGFDLDEMTGNLDSGEE